jgi:cold shock protein
MPNGTVKFFNAQKGFGFITPDDGGKDVFVPTASITASGIAGLKPGLRIAFETQPDGKGPKAVGLQVIAAAPIAQVHDNRPQPAEAPSSAPRLTAYIDPQSDLAMDAIGELRDAGFEPRIVDYVANPPTADELKALSLLLRRSDQSLVRKFDALFSELRLDDRFISDGEYWAAVHEHPSLINGPVLATATGARVCRTESAVEAFIAWITAGENPTALKPKGLPPRLLRLLKGDTAEQEPAMPEPPAQNTAEVAPTPPKQKAENDNRGPAVKKIKGEAKPEPKAAAAKPASKTKAKAPAKPKAVAKPKAPAKKIDKKSIKKSRGG